MQKNTLGALVAGPVFREVADKLMSMESLVPDSNQLAAYTGLMKKDSAAYYYSGATEEIKKIMYSLQMPYADSSRDKKWSGVYREKNQPLVKAKNEEAQRVPDVKGMGLKDALYLLESDNIQVAHQGNWKSKTTKYCARNHRIEKPKTYTGTELMTLQEILYKVRIRSVHGQLNVEVKDLQLDSRKVKEGSVFIAVKGTHTDGHQFIESVVTAAIRQLLSVNKCYPIR